MKTKNFFSFQISKLPFGNNRGFQYKKNFLSSNNLMRENVKTVQMDHFPKLKKKGMEKRETKIKIYKTSFSKNRALRCYSTHNDQNLINPVSPLERIKPYAPFPVIPRMMGAILDSLIMYSPIYAIIIVQPLFGLENIISTYQQEVSVATGLYTFAKSK